MQTSYQYHWRVECPLVIIRSGHGGTTARCVSGALRGLSQCNLVRQTSCEAPGPALVPGHRRQQRKNRVDQPTSECRSAPPSRRRQVGSRDLAGSLLPDHHAAQRYYSSVSRAIASEPVRPSSCAQLSTRCWSSGLMPLLAASASIIAASACCLVNSRSGSHDTIHAPRSPAVASGLLQATCGVSVLAISSSLIRRAATGPPAYVRSTVYSSRNQLQ